MQSNYLKSLNNYLCRQQPTESALRCQHLLTKTNNNFCHLFFENKLAPKWKHRHKSSWFHFTWTGVRPGPILIAVTLAVAAQDQRDRERDH